MTLLAITVRLVEMWPLLSKKTKKKKKIWKQYIYYPKI